MHLLKKPIAALGKQALAASAIALMTAGAATAKSPLPPGAIKHVMVIEMENESYDVTYGANSPAVYLNNTLRPQGELIEYYYATGHVSLDNYISEVSGQEPTVSTNDDCINLQSLSNPPVVGSFTDVTPGTRDKDKKNFPGQIVGDGCVYPAPVGTFKGAQTIGDQIDAKYEAAGEHKKKIHWREYAEDMGNDAARDHGDIDPNGIGRDCAHPPVSGDDLTNTAEAIDQYADRHNPFIYFHSVIDDSVRCDSHVVPLGTAQVGQGGDVFVGHLHDDLLKASTTPDFMFVTPNLCDDGHDATCAGTNIEGGTTGGLVGLDLWLKHYMPMIFASPAYKDGSLLVVVTFDEAATTDATACPNLVQSECGSPIGPNVSNPGYSTILALFGAQTPPTQNYVYPGGGQVGALLFNKKYIVPGTLNTTGVYNHYSALRSYEDLLGITTGGDDGKGHLGYAAAANEVPYGTDVFNKQ
jgi:hypothetical protein